MPLSSLPLLHEDDSFILELEELSEKTVKLRRILRFEGNQNVEGADISFYDLDSRARDAVLHRIQRKFSGRTIKL